jgi:putative peptidoglycan lipid II flippase
VAGAALAVVLILGGATHRHGGSAGGSTGTTVQLQGVGNAYSNSGHPDTHADTAASATDGSTATYWYTQTYGDQTFGGLLTGLGLVLDAESPVKLTQVTVTTPTPGFTAEIQSGDSAAGPFVPDSSSQTVSGTTTFTLNGSTAQYYVVWITELPPERYVKISEVTAKS